MPRFPCPTRRAVISGLAAAGVFSVLPTHRAAAQPATVLTRAIPSSGEAVPLVGLGSWITFNVGEDPVLRAECTDVMRAFFAAGGRMIDSSPMYGSSQAVIGHGLAALGRPERLFSADKVWTSGDGAEQIAESERRWGVQSFDLLQVHNLVAWEEQLELLFAMKAEGSLRYVGITTSEGRRHGLFEEVMASAPLDFIQVTYNVLDREVEERILPLAAERGIAVIVNRPFRQGALTEDFAGVPLPGFASEIGCTTWAQLLLKFIVSHPAVTTAIPATTRVDHVVENMAAASEPLPDAAMRARIVAAVEIGLMSDWLSYSLTDFLLFAPRTYYRLFALYNADLWPLQIAVLAAGVVILLLVFSRGPAWRGRAVAALLAAAWLFVGWAWHFHRYDAINFAGRWFALAFAVEALLLVAVGVLRGGLGFAPRAHPAGMAGMAIFAFALALQPLIGPLAGRDWASAEIFGLAPDPTAVGTLGLLLAAERMRWSLIVIPVLWCVVTGLTLWTMGASDAFVTPVAGLIVLGLAG